MGKNSQTKNLVGVIEAIGTAKKAPVKKDSLLKVELDRTLLRAAQGLFAPGDPLWKTLQNKINKKETRAWFLTTDQVNMVLRLAIFRLKALGSIGVRPDGQVGVLFK